MAVQKISAPPAGPEETKEIPSEEISPASNTGDEIVSDEVSEAPEEGASENAENNETNDANEGNAENNEEGASEDEDAPISRRKARDLRNEARNLRQRNRGLAEEIDASKKAVEELQRKLEEANKRLAEIETTSARKAVQSKYSLSDKLMRFVSGSSEEELENSAKEIFEALSPTGTDFSGLKVGGGKTAPPSDIGSMTDEEILKKFKG